MQKEAVTIMGAGKANGNDLVANVLSASLAFLGILLAVLSIVAGRVETYKPALSLVPDWLWTMAFCSLFGFVAFGLISLFSIAYLGAFYCISEAFHRMALLYSMFFSILMIVTVVSWWVLFDVLGVAL